MFDLSRQALNELQILAILGPACQADLRVKYSEFIYCTDASPSGGAVVRAKVGVSCFKRVVAPHRTEKFLHKIARSHLANVD